MTLAKNMCSEVIIGSNKTLPTIPWSEDDPQLYILEEKVSSLPDFALAGMDSKFYYSVGSFLGCSCGLHYGDWSLSKVSEEHEKRVRDVKLLKSFLMLHSVSAELVLVSLSFDIFPDSVDTKDYYVDRKLPEEFDLEEDIILRIVTQ